MAEIDGSYYGDKYSEKRPRRREHYREHYHHRMNFSPRHRKYCAAVHHGRSYHGDTKHSESREHSSSSSSLYYRPRSPHYHYQSPRHLNHRQYQPHEHSYSSSSYSKKKSSSFYRRKNSHHNPSKPRFQRPHEHSRDHRHHNNGCTHHTPPRSLRPQHSHHTSNGNSSYHGEYGIHPNDLDTADSVHHHQSHNHHHHSNEIYMSPPDSISTSLQSSQPDSPASRTVSSSLPPHALPSLFFPLKDNHSKETADLVVTEEAHNNDSHGGTPSNEHDEMEVSAMSTPSAQLSGLPNLCSLGTAPPLSALSLSDGKMLQTSEDLSILSKLPVSEIQNELNAQRLKNESLLAKLQRDQKRFLKVCKHYDKKNELLKSEVAMHKESNNHSAQSAKRMKTLLSEHERPCDLNQQEPVQAQITKTVLCKEVSTNMKLLSEINELNKQIDSYHLLVAKKNRQLAEEFRWEKGAASHRDQNNEEETDLYALVMEKETEREEEENNTIEEMKALRVMANGDEDSKQIETETVGDRWEMDGPTMHDISGQQAFDTMSVMSATTSGCTGDPLENYADQLIARNKRYQEILALLRNKVDELRACRNKL